MNSRNNFNWMWFLFVFVFIAFPIGGVLWPLLLILAVVLIVTFAAVAISKKQDAQSGNQSYYNQTNNYYQSSNTKYNASDIARINVYLRHYFQTGRILPVTSDYSLQVNGTRYASLASLDVYHGNQRIGSFTSFQRKYPQDYDEIMSQLLIFAKEPDRDNVFDAEVVDTTDNKKEEVKKEEKKKPETAQDYIDTINSLNNDIPDKEISDGLFETCALLKQIQTLEKKFPDSKPKLKKLYEYYLPILVKILQQYANLQSATSDEAYEKTKQQLTRTIKLINEAMKKIISSMTDEDFINLAADISTLEAVLQKDGLTDEGTMSSKSDSHE